MKVFLEYLWLDGSETQQLRGKTMVYGTNVDRLQVDHFPVWSFDGSSTNQAEAGESKNTDCILKPVFVCDDPFRGKPHKLVLCDVYESDGKTPHKTNQRIKLKKFIDDNNLGGVMKSDQPWFGWEQEYTLMTKPDYKGGEGLPLGFRPNSEPRAQGDYYCGVGSDNVIGRKIAEEHLEKCVEIGLDISGINAEVLLGQWEYQIGPVTALKGSDQLWISRYLLHRIAENHGIKISFHPKPKKGDEWNGSGCHVNFSNVEMRGDGGIVHILKVMDSLRDRHDEHISVYGLHNEERSTGKLETSDINKFTYGYSTRDTSVRIPIKTKIDGRGYFEDRRPASNCDPYMVSKVMLESVYNTVESMESRQ
ncbi:MAG: glutamine synthetase [Candidatus Dadabacteria bacterium]|nr:glutamine synthetase [Candidatus Dadabacteria bacterium]